MCDALFSYKKEEKVPAFSFTVCANINQTQESCKAIVQFLNFYNSGVRGVKNHL